MDNKEINIIDSYKIDDSHSKIRGIVSLYDEKGNLIFIKENMILFAGRKAIFDAIFKRKTAPEIVGAVFGDNSNITTPNMGLSDITSDGTDKYILVTPIADLDEEVIETSKLSKVYTIILDINENKPISCMGLVFEQSDSPNEKKLFSRVVFPTQYTGSNRTLTFKYYLYF